MPLKRQTKIYIAASFFLLAMGITLFNQMRADFDADQWEQSTEATRYKLSKALIVHLNLNQPTRDEVLRLLGPPDRKVGDSLFQYELGRNSSFPFFPRDKWWLSISFKNGRVVEARRNAD